MTSGKGVVMRIRFLVALSALMLVGCATHSAAQSTFPGKLPVGCSDAQIAVYQASTKTWICGSGSGTGNVTAAGTLTANLPVIGAGTTAVAVGTRSGNTTAYVTTTGTLTSGDCVKIDASGNFIANGSACGSGGGAPTDATYITQTASSGLSAEQALGALATGVLISTTSTGVVSIKAANTCTNQFARSDTASAVWTCASVNNADIGSSAAIALSKLAAQAANTVVMNNTAGSAVPTAVTTTDLATALGIIDIPSLAQGDILYASATDTISALAKATSGTQLLSNTGSNNNPAWVASLTLPFHLIFDAAVCQNATASVGGSLPTTLGAAGACVSTTAASGEPAYGTATFVTGGANTEWHGHFPVPSDWTGAVDLNLKWNSLSNASGNVVWEVQFGCVATGEVPTGISFNNSVFAAVANQTSPTAALNISSKTGITTTGCAAGEEAFFIVHRDTDTSGDTLDQDVQLLTIDFVYRRLVVIGG